MKRAVASLLLALWIVGGAVSAAPAFSPAHRLRSCRYESAGRPGWTEWKVRAELSCAVSHFAVPGGFGTMLAVAERESGLGAGAVNRYSGACGLFQHIPRYWPGRVADYNAHVGPRLDVAPGCFNARSNALVSAWMMATGRLYPWR